MNASIKGNPNESYRDKRIHRIVKRVEVLSNNEPTGDGGSVVVIYSKKMPAHVKKSLEMKLKLIEICLDAIATSAEITEELNDGDLNEGQKETLKNTQEQLDNVMKRTCGPS